MKAILFMLAAIAVTVTVDSVYAFTPFDVSAKGVTIESYYLDPQVNSVILQVEVSKPDATLEIKFDREFFDSTYDGLDDEFLVIGDGDYLTFKETETSSASRTIKVTLTSDIEEVEIFGSRLLGRTIDEHAINISQIKEQNTSLLDEKEFLTNQISELSAKLDETNTKNSLLEYENEQLGKTIFNPDNLVEETQVQANNLFEETQVQANNLFEETQVQANNLFEETEVQANNLFEETQVQSNNLNSIIMEQINAITAWFKSLF